jgi:Family of unknown function (DUF6463)
VSEADIVRMALFPIMVVGGFWIQRSGRHVIGRWLMLIGTLHLTGLWVGRNAVARIVAGGVIGQGDSDVGHLVERTNQELIFWFALWGVWTIFVGQLVNTLEDRGLPIPTWFGWQFLVVNLLAAILIPKAGFWWVLVPAALIIKHRVSTPVDNQGHG